MRTKFVITFLFCLNRMYFFFVLIVAKRKGYNVESMRKKAKETKLIFVGSLKIFFNMLVLRL